ncbi:FecR family protein [Brucella pseudogrignonensis]|uniref:FecR family protein n=1 Tax=Brucella pseudogrignonensis TaxID=419475 RepID=UPI003D98E488
MEHIDQEAIAWFTRINGEPSSADQKNFEVWLNKSPLHNEAYRRISSRWVDADLPSAMIASEDAAQLSGYLDAIEQVRKRRRVRNALAGVAGILVAALVGFDVWIENPHFLQNLSADYVTARAERQTITLPDGSTVLLDADSAMSTDMTAEKRSVKFLRGAAYFDVKSSEIPFVVDAGRGETRVTGTAFSVEILGKDVAVNLARGHVIVSSEADGQSAKLEAGQGVGYDNVGLGSVHPVAIDEAMAWQKGRLIFDQARLGDILNQIGRYRSGRVVVLGNGLADQLVSGNLPLEDSDSALASLQATVGFRISHLTGKLVIISP